MAKSITGTFTLTEELMINSLGFASATIPIGSLIDVGDAQALEIESVDYIFMNYDSAAQLYEPIRGSAPFAGDTGFGAQLMDKNAGTFISPADNNLISSAMVVYDNAVAVSADTDFFPDDFQKTNGRFVVNDELYLVGYASSAAASSQNLVISVRIRAKVVKLSTRDWMAISLETVQNE